MKKLSFHEWKSRQVDEDSRKAGVQRYYRTRDWYYSAYGIYAQQFDKIINKV